MHAEELLVKLFRSHSGNVISEKFFTMMRSLSRMISCARCHSSGRFHRRCPSQPPWRWERHSSLQAVFKPTCRLRDSTISNESVAGRKRQPFSAALTYSRGQTHDPIHFDYPREMTGGMPPQPSLSVGSDQAILAKRLMAKEVLRRPSI